MEKFFPKVLHFSRTAKACNLINYIKLNETKSIKSEIAPTNICLPE